MNSSPGMLFNVTSKAKEAGRSFGGCEPLAAHVGGDGPGNQSALVVYIDKSKLDCCNELLVTST